MKANYDETELNMHSEGNTPAEWHEKGRVFAFQHTSEKNKGKWGFEEAPAFAEQELLNSKQLNVKLLLISGAVLKCQTNTKWSENGEWYEAALKLAWVIVR